MTLILAQGLLPVLGHSHDEQQHGDPFSHAGFHVHFDGSHHYAHDHDADDDAAEPGFSNRSEAPGVAYLGFTAWDVVKPTNATDGIDVSSIATLAAVPEPWFEWPPAPIAKPPTSKAFSLELPLYLSLCTFRC